MACGNKTNTWTLWALIWITKPELHISSEVNLTIHHNPSEDTSGLSGDSSAIAVAGVKDIGEEELIVDTSWVIPGWR